MKETTKKREVTIYLPSGLHRALKIRAAEEGGSLTGIVERAVRSELRKPRLEGWRSETADIK